MTIDARLESIAIGATDANIFLCPRCTRPLAVGVSRCPGCRTRLVSGIPLKKATGLVGIGVAAGLTTCAGLIALVAVLGGPAASVGQPSVVQPSVAAVPSSAPAASVAPPTVDPAVPRAALSALRQSALVNQRLLADSERLARVVARTNPSATAITPLLRGLAATAAFGDRLAPDVATWAKGAAFAERLAAFYSAIGRVADDGLAASVTNDRAYAQAGRQMVSVLRRLTDLDAASRALAADAGVELPPLIAG